VLFLALDSIFLGPDKGQLVLGSLVVGARAYLQGHFYEVKLMVVIAIVI
jgi:hypothetical protein